MSIIDKRQSTKNYKSAGNRKKFIDRYKGAIKKKVQEGAHKGGITDVGTKRNVSVGKKDLAEPSFRKDRTKGNKTRVLPGNKEFRKSDQVKRPPQGAGGSGSGGGPDSADELDQFQFTLTKEEFLELYFSDMALPNYVKEVLLQDNKKKFKRAGYTNQGVPARLDLKKTFEQAIARKIATKAGGKDNPRYLDDVDLRYRQYTPQPVPNRQAVMFCIMDTSGSMSQMAKDLAKRFYILLYLFLEKEYEAVELVFIRHTHIAEEVDEETFFYDRSSGGTVVTSALELMREIMTERFPPSEWNIYACQASDGDVWSGEDDKLPDLLEDILADVQYYAYVQIERQEPTSLTGLLKLYSPLAEKHSQLNLAVVWEERHIYPVFQDLFKKENGSV